MATEATAETAAADTPLPDPPGEGATRDDEAGSDLPPLSDTSRRRPELYRVARISNFLAKPETFSGTGHERFHDFELWGKKLKSYLSTVDPHYETMMNIAQTSAASSNFRTRH